jgi:hypothetical protein
MRTEPETPLAQPSARDVALVSNAWEETLTLLNHLRDIEKSVRQTSTRLQVHRAADAVRLAFCELEVAYRRERHSQPPGDE